MKSKLIQFSAIFAYLFTGKLPKIHSGSDLSPVEF
jgi:hypothetical protein